jgi:hypothetical protein
VTLVSYNSLIAVSKRFLAPISLIDNQSRSRPQVTNTVSSNLPIDTVVRIII